MMVQPKICSECEENRHENCIGKKISSKFLGIQCECFICKSP